ncbi:hypothetical protein B0J17DRAFT_637648 [Rhizoctonia solani]|nr:hypothetical protein B0J17DRAFT_637648 [Rhizoctonia solani]
MNAVRFHRCVPFIKGLFVPGTSHFRLPSVMARSFVVGALAAISLFATQVHAQTEPISINSAGWTPCLVSAYLSAQCTTDNSWGVPAVGTEGPLQSVQWNLLSACSMCQGGGASTWQRWTVNCSSTVTTTPSQGGYPLSIPSGVLVPHWAYHDFTLSGVFNAVIGVESSAVAAATPTASSATGVPRTTDTPAATSTSVTSSDDAKSSGSNTGAIVGGVVGGIVGIALIAGIAFIVLRKNKQNKSSSAESQYNQSNYNQSLGPQPGSGAPMMGQYQPTVQNSGMSQVTGSEYKPYDPSDPSTFPTHNHTVPSHYAESIPYSHQNQARPGQYNGVPEI